MAGAEAEPQVPGVTAVDLEHLALRRSAPPKRNRLVSWISGIDDTPEAAETTAPPGSLNLPTPEVKREIFRLELQAKLAELTAEADAIKADEAIESGGTVAPGTPADATADGSSASAAADSAESAGLAEDGAPAPGTNPVQAGPSTDPGATIDPGSSMDSGSGGPSPA